MTPVPPYANKIAESLGRYLRAYRDDTRVHLANPAVSNHHALDVSAHELIDANQLMESLRNWHVQQTVKRISGATAIRVTGSMRFSVTWTK